MILNNLREKLKNLFLDELRVDEGWNAYINLLVSNLDTSVLEYLQTNGFPYSLDTATLGDVFDITVSSERTEISYPKRVNPKYLDFSETAIKLPKDTISCSVDGQSVDVKFGYIEWSGDQSLSLVTSGDTVLELLNIPESINPQKIQSYLEENFKTFDANNVATSPQALFGELFKVVGLDFYLVFKSKIDVSRRVKQFQKYASFYNIQQCSRLVRVTVNGQAMDEERGFVSANSVSDLTIDALRDLFGYGSQKSKILGYDKRYLVVDSNVKDNELIYLTADVIPDSGIRVMVSPDTINFPQHSEPEPLRTPSLDFMFREWSNGAAILIGSIYPVGYTIRVGYYSKEGEQIVTYEGPDAGAMMFIRAEGFSSNDTITLWAQLVGSVSDGTLDSEIGTQSIVLGQKSLSAPVLSVSLDDNVLNISWSAVQNATNYTVVIQKVGGDTIQYETESTSYSYEVEYDTSWNIQVIASADDYIDGVSESVSISVAEGTISNPTATWVVKDFPQTELSVDAVENASIIEYTVLHEIDNTTEAGTIQASGEIISNFSELKQGNNVLTLIARGSEGYSDSGTTVKTLVANKLSAPVIDVVADQAGQSVMVSWSAVSGANSYVVKIGDISETTSALSLTKSLTPGTYTVEVVAKGVNVFESDAAISSITLNSNDINVSQSEVTLAQRATSAYVDVTSESEWDVKDSVESASTFSLRSSRAVEATSAPSVAQVVVSTKPASEFTTDLAEALPVIAETYCLTAQDGTAVSESAPFYALLAPESKIYEVLWGITKNYSMLSSSLGQVQSIDLFIEGNMKTVKKLLGDKFDEWYNAIETILENSVPAGSKFTINFILTEASGDVYLSDRYSQLKQILVNGFDNRKQLVIEFSQRSDNKSVNVSTEPEIFEFEPKSE